MRAPRARSGASAPRSSIHCMRSASRILARSVTAALAGAFLVAAGCESDSDLWGDAMTPTQMQQAQMGGPAPVNEFATSSGDSEDPFVDNASYPFVQGPWWSNPAYNGG